MYENKICIVIYTQNLFYPLLIIIQYINITAYMDSRKKTHFARQISEEDSVKPYAKLTLYKTL